MGKVIERHNDGLDVCIDHMADCPIDQPDELKKLLALARLPARVRQDQPPLVAVAGEVSLPDTHDQVKRLYDAVRSAAPDVGHRLAGGREVLRLRQGAGPVPRRDCLLHGGRPPLDSRRHRPETVAVCLNLVIGRRFRTSGVLS